jgi:hypothetical protein
MTYWIHGDRLGLPCHLELLATFGGALSLSVISVIAVIRLRNIYRSQFPFLTGPPTTR